MARPYIDLVPDACNLRLSDNGRVIYVFRSADCGNVVPVPMTRLVEHGRDQDKTHEVPLITDGDPTTIEFREAGPREVQAFRVGSWREIPNVDTWVPRDGAGLLVKDGYAWLLGGWLHGPGSNEVWKSSNLVDWEFLGFAPWAGRHGAAWVVHDDRLYVIGGDLAQDVWSSADGVNWRLENGAAPFGKRYTPNAASMRGQLYVYAGMRWLPEDWCLGDWYHCEADAPNDVWRSNDGGRNWERILAKAPWPGRALIHGSIVHEGQLYLIGGGLKVLDTSKEFTDIWSSRDGISWMQRSSTLPFPARTHFSVASTSFGCVVSDGSVGFQANVTNDLFIARDCVNFKAVENRPLPARHASSVAEFNGTLVILGGPPAGGAGTAIWQYFP